MTSDDTASPLKIVLLGDSGTGKTNLLARLTGNKFNKQWTPTKGVDMATHHLLMDNNMVNIEFWDFAGQEKYRTVANSMLNGVVGIVGILLVYDISNYATFENVTGWLKDITQWAEAKTVIKLVGNKSDLKHQRAVPMEEANQWAAEHGLFCVETSALYTSNIKVTLERMIQEIRATMNSVSQNADHAGIFSTCSFIASRMTKEHISGDSPSNDTQPFHVVLVDIKKAAKFSIECVEKRLDDPDLKYVALSYRWGELGETVIDTKVGYTAMIKSFDLGTFYELCRIMVREVDLKDMDYLWVDAICVDQTNYERRKATIYQMSAIYERADYILAVPDLHAAHLRETSTLHSNAMVYSVVFQMDLYYLIHGNTDQLARVEDEWLDKYGAPNDSALRQSLKRDTDYFMDGLMTYREHHQYYNADEILDHIADHHRHEAATTNGIEEDHPRDWRRDSDDASLSMEHLHDCHQIDCPLDLFHKRLPDWRVKMIYKTGNYPNQTWKQMVIARSTELRRSVDFMTDLIKDWSSRVWVISEYNIAKKKNNMKYWFTQLGEFDDMKEITFFPFDFTDTSLAATIEGIHDSYSNKSSDPPYITFHRTMINQLKQQTFFEMTLKSKASKNEDRFYAIFPVIPEYKNMVSNKDVVASWKIDTLVSVKVKLFEVMNTKDKLNLLFSSGNCTAEFIGEALPTFATSSILWYETMEHFTLYGKDINHAHYNFDLTSPSTLTLHYHPCDRHPNLSDLPYLNLKPKEFYVVDSIKGPWKDRFNRKLPGARQLWRLLQPQELTLKKVCIPSWTGTAMKGCDDIVWSHHVIYLVGDKKRNIWILEPAEFGFFSSPEFDDYTHCITDCHCPGFNIY